MTIATILTWLRENNLTKNGKRRTSSTSNTKKIKAIKKNRNVNGNRALNFGEKPHSKGLIFSRSRGNFLLNLIPAKVTRITNKNTKRIKFTKIKIKKRKERDYYYNNIFIMPKLKKKDI